MCIYRSESDKAHMKQNKKEHTQAHTLKTMISQNSLRQEVQSYAHHRVQDLLIPSERMEGWG